MAKRRSQAVAEERDAAPELPENVVLLFGEEIELVRPKGTAGLRFMPKAHRAYRRLLAVIEQSEETVTGRGTSRYRLADELIGLIDTLITTDEFIEQVLPGLYMWSTRNLDYKQALAYIEQQVISTEATAEIFEAFTKAINFWGVSSDEEALETALKKSTPEETTDTAEEDGT